MITRPLDLASKLRPLPQNFDWVFYVNAGLLGLFFSLFGSKFVLAPGLALELPRVSGAVSDARPATHVVSVTASGRILTEQGDQTISELRAWLIERAKGTASPVLLVHADADVQFSLIADITSVAKDAGFDTLMATEEPRRPASSGGR
jgi:biopolymer transport protein ExbD